MRIIKREISGRLTNAVRGLGALLLVALGLALGVWALGRMARGSLPGTPRTFDAKLAKEAKKLRNVNFDNDPAKLPTFYLPGPVRPQHESPLLTELVKKGVIPPLADRMPEDPVVMQGKDGIGKYGGTWLRLASNEGDIAATVFWRMSGSFLCRWSPLGYPIEPFIAKSIDHSPDMKVWTIKLRKGLRWSNGDPYTANDVMFWWNDLVRNDVMNNGEKPQYEDWLLVNGEPPTIEKVNDYEFTVAFKAPDALFEEQLCTHQGGNMVGAPSKYLRPYHPDPKIGNAAIIARDMKGFKQPSAKALFGFIRDYQNTDMPSLAPWIYKSFRSQTPQVFVRNPYFFGVDSAGNQLPYIDRVQVETREQPQLMTISVANGDASMQDRGVDFTGYTEFMSRRAISHTKVLHWYPATRQIWVINPNSNRKIDEGDPSTVWKKKLLAEKKFRQAMSVAINRHEIIEAEYFGLGEPSQVSPGPMSAYDNEDLGKKYTEYSPSEANKWLDELGLTKRDYEGYRTFPDGSRMTFFLDYCEFTNEGPAQFVLDDWKAVGVRVSRRMLPRALFSVYNEACDFDFNVWQSESDIVPLLEPSYFILRDADFAMAWGRWYKLGGFHGNPQALISGVDPGASENGKPMMEEIKLYERALRTTELRGTKDKPGRIELFRQIQTIAAENVWTIGIATAPPALAIIKDDLMNVPDRALYGPTFSTPSNTGVETYFFKNPPANPSADADLISAMEHPTNRPGAADDTTSQVTWVSTFLRFAFVGILISCGLLAALKHPFVWRRFLILIPMLAFISVIVFTIIQLPPGDFISHRRSELMEIHDANMNQELEDLRIQFHTDDPMWKNYFRWTGITWFTSFKASDEGLLEGNLGRSMSADLPVNDIIGDRILLTVLLSLGTVLFTWMLALPIGIYSAVRQYTMTDYVMTVVGFIGMSVPGFLLALVLMAASGFTGLFSPHYATQPAWTFGKVIDLCEHLWIPVLVLAIGGTAGMIRVMRANLLDELRKPYVTTARAKGVRPLKLLIKYPVRIAVNPFVSGIGGLFPALVSGGSIVAIVLSLPMVGPVLLDSLTSEDVYTAASMLMVLSVLGVLGTVVSDLLLLWLDPRIRYEGGSR